MDDTDRGVRARLAPADPDGLDPRTRRVLNLLPPLDLFRTAAHGEVVFRRYQALGAAIYGELELDSRVRQLAILAVARLTRCEYEWVQHEPIARAVGVSADAIDAVRAMDLGSAALDERAQSALSFVRALVDDPAECGSEASTAVDLFNPREIVELIVTTGFYVLTAQLAHGLGLSPESPNDAIRTLASRSAESDG